MMSLLLPLLLAVASPITLQDDRRPTDAEIQRAHQLLAGTWDLTSVVDGGERLGAELIRQKIASDGRVVIADRSIQILNPETGETKRWVFRLDISRNPRRIDIITSDDRILRGIFKFEGDSLVLCVPHHDDAKTAAAFDAPAGSGLMLLTLKTIAGASPPVIADAPAVADRATPAPRRATPAEMRQQHDLLAGDWDILAITNDGEQLGADLIRSRIAEDGRIHIGERGFYLTNPRTEQKRSSTMRINPALSPSTIEVTNQFDDQLRGIYEFRGDKLYVCMNKFEGSPTPTAFEAPRGSDRVLYVLRLAAARPREVVATPAPAPPPSRAELAVEKEEKIRGMLVGSWSYNDRKGTVTIVVQSDGTFVMTRVANRNRLFEPNSTTTSGRWTYGGGLLNANFNRSTDPRLLNHAYIARIKSIGENTMVASDMFGELQNFKKLR
jgi:uncharacterized protein (TIGR03067 family)